MTDPSHDRHEGSAAAYLLGALPDLEQRAFERHVMSCVACREEVERLRAAAEALPLSATPVTPPARLRRSLMAAVAEEVKAAPAGSARPREGIVRRGRARVWSALAGLRPAVAGAAAALLVAGVLAGLAGAELLGEGSGGTRIAAEVDHSRLAEGSGTLLLEEDQDRAILSVHGVPTLPDDDANRVYQTWLVRGDEVIPSTVFSVDSEGAGVATISEGVEDADAIMVTREAAGGARAPTEPPVMEVDLG